MKTGVANWLWIVPLLLLVTGFATLELNDPVVLDEMYSFRHTGFFADRYSAIETIQSVATISPQHVPLYFVSLSAWVNLTGVSKVTMRILSLLIGLISISLAYRFACSVISPRFALFAVLVMPLFAYFFYYLHEIRMYSMLPGLIFLLYWKYWHIMLCERQPHLIDWIVLYGTATALMYTHYISIFPLLAIGFYHLIAKKDRRWLKVTGVMMLAGLTFALWLPVVIKGFETRTPLGQTNQSLWQLIVSLAQIYTNHFIVLIAVYLVGLVALLRSHEKHLSYIVTIIVVPVLAILVMNNITPLLPLRRMRYSIIMLPSFILLFSYALYRLYRWRRAIVVIILAVLFVTFFTFKASEEIGIYTARIPKDSAQWPPIHSILQYIDHEQYMPEPEPVFTMSPDTLSLTSVAGNYAKYVKNDYIHIHDTLIQTSLNLASPDILPVLIDFENEPAFWLAYRPEFDPTLTDTYQTVLTRYHRSCGVRKSDETMIIEYFLRIAIPCQLIDSDFRVQYENFGIVISHFYYEITDHQLKAYFIWERTSTKSAFPYSISFQFLDSNGDKVLQQDFIAPFEPIDPKTFDISEFSEGTYTLTLTLYKLDTGDVNHAIANDSGQLLSSIILARFSIT